MLQLENSGPAQTPAKSRPLVPKIDNANWPIWLAGIVGYSYVIAVPLEPYPGHPIIKAIPLLVLSVTAWRRLVPPLRVPFAIALLASAVGDCLLGIDRSAFLKPALFSFLVTQMLYAWLFWRERDDPLSGRGLMVVELIALFGLYFLIIPAVPEGMIIPVIVYSTALLAMATGAAGSSIGRLLPLGGALFFVADNLIAVNQFVWPFPHSTRIIVTLYMTAQLMISWSVFAWARQNRTQ